MEKDCSKYRDTMYLDVCGELDPDLQWQWQQHLDACGRCRRERQKLAETIDISKNAAPVQETPSGPAPAFTRTVLSRLKSEYGN